jgi:predicted glutamine amidotransferase
MCGLVGIASSNLILGDKNVFTTLLYLDELRGEHSTGVCAVSRTGESNVYKRALKASDFIQLKGYTNILAKADRVLMGHNRYATMGAKDDNNAHPFTHGDITLMHNGTLRNKGVVNKCANTFVTDSETVAWAIATDDTIEVLERLQGAYALVWYDAMDKVLHFARNEERPLYIGKIGNDIVWASEKAMLELVAEHHKKQLKDVELLPIGELRMYDCDAISADPQTLEFTPYKAPPVVYDGKSGMNGYYGGNTNRRSKIKAAAQTLEATLVEVRSTGYMEAVADDGALVSGNIGDVLLADMQAAAALGKRIVGTIASESSRWTQRGYVDQYYLAGNSISIIDEEVADSGTEKKCQICHSSTSLLGEIEYHYGEYFHTLCLDGRDDDFHNLYKEDYA